MSRFFFVCSLFFKRNLRKFAGESEFAEIMRKSDDLRPQKKKSDNRQVMPAFTKCIISHYYHMMFELIDVLANLLPHGNVYG